MSYQDGFIDNHLLVIGSSSNLSSIGPSASAAALFFLPPEKESLLPNEPITKEPLILRWHMFYHWLPLSFR